MISVKRKKYELLDGSVRKMVEQVNQGKIIARFDKTPVPKCPKDVVCPHFLEFKWGYGCPHMCAWCYLQGCLSRLPTKTRPVVKDLDAVKKHLLSFISASHTQPEMLNTGEIADSLMSENSKRPLSKEIMPIVQGTPHKILYLSKMKDIHHFLDNAEQWKEHAVMSFSVNAYDVAERWERLAPHPEERIDAARRLSRAAYQVRLRIDPIVAVQNWENSYKGIIDNIFRKFRPERITLGTLRGLRRVIAASRDRSWVEYLDEKTNWGKRISLPIRVKIYRTLIDYLKNKYDFDQVAICKDTVEVHDMVGSDWRNLRCNCV
jgi:spore photoproduct lyase